MVLNVLA